MKKIVLSIVFIVYIVLTLTVTFFLNKYNRFGVIEVGEKLIVTSNKADMNYRKGTILIITKGTDNLNVGDEVFFYTADKSKILVAKDKITNIEDVTETEKTLSFKDSRKFSIEYVIGKTKNLVKIPVLGYLLMALTSKIGYLITIVLPISVFFFVQLYSLIKRKKA